MHISSTHSIAIRPAQIADGKTVWTWIIRPEIAALDNPAHPSLVSFEDFTITWAAVVAQQTTWMLCRQTDQGERLIGQVGWVRGGGLSAELFITIADPMDRGSGIGRDAIAWLEQQAGNRGLESLISRVLGHNIDAQRFFSHLGYKLYDIQEKQIVRGGCYFPIYGYSKPLVSTNVAHPVPIEIPVL